MTKQEYKDALNRIELEIDRLEEERNSLRESFLRINSQFSVGEKVVVVYDETNLFGRKQPERRIECYISGIDDKWFSGDVRYSFAKCKKDGTMSGQSAGIYSGYSRIEKLKSDN